MTYLFYAFLINGVIQEPIVVSDNIDNTEIVKSATQGYVHCLVYHALRTDDGSISAERLVSVVRHKCAVDDVVWKVFLRESLVTELKPEQEIAIVEDVMEDHLKKSATDTVERILYDVRIDRNLGE